MMTGMPASSSIAMPSGRFSQSGHSSVMKMAMPKLTGTPNSMAISRGDQRAVDRRQRAELSVTGFHTSR